MQRRRLAPAFVVTLTALAACDKPAKAPHGEHAVKAKHDAKLQQRSVRDPLPAWQEYPGPIEHASTKELNPKDGEGRTIYAGRYGGCYVYLPFPADEPTPPPGTEPPTRAVDCTEVMQDPAWDTCIGGSLLRVASGQCACEQMGNPPPPPATAECPKSSDR